VLGLVADLGTLQRLPKIIPYAHAAEMAYTGRSVFGEEAKRIHLVGNCFPDRDQLMKAALKLAAEIALHSPLVVRGIKETLLHTRDNSVDSGLNFIANFNAAFLSEDDIQQAFAAKMQNSKPDYLP
ncbi:MAG: enoyl-CoA hydratase, partial [Saprospiraceae bacterium]|nr:enoyl-CoA hydratase [Saprospiraceae bacterium]